MHSYIVSVFIHVYFNQLFTSPSFFSTSMQSRGFLFTLHDIYLCVVHLFASALLNYITRAEIQPGGFMPFYQMC